VLFKHLNTSDGFNKRQEDGGGWGGRLSSESDERTTLRSRPFLFISIDASLEGTGEQIGAIHHHSSTTILLISLVQIELLHVPALYTLTGGKSQKGLYCYNKRYDTIQRNVTQRRKTMRTRQANCFLSKQVNRQLFVAPCLL
jgi:hypothetical protein